MTIMPDTILAIKNLAIKFQEVVLNISDMTLKTGQTLALVGESGSGKSLTSLAVMGLLPHTAAINTQAEIIYHSQNLLDLSEVEMQKIRGKKISLIFQEALSALNPVMKIGKQINEVLKTHKIICQEGNKKHILQLLREVGMPDAIKCYNSYPHQLSGGMNQRVMIAIALASEPEILIADEPTTALDSSVQSTILRLLCRIKKNRNMSLLFITHNLSLIKDFADDVAVMYKGEIIEKNNTNDFLKDPQHSYSKELLAAFKLKTARKKTSNKSTEVLQVTNLSIKYYQPYWLTQKVSFALQNISFALESGETLAIIGESGSGKTSIAKALMQLVPSSANSIKLAGSELIANKYAKRICQKNIQMIFQNPDTSMNPRFTIDNIMLEGLNARDKKLCSNIQEKIIKKMLMQVGLEHDICTRYPHEFSGGQKQRICIARALCMQPQVIICDEPTSALDIATQIQVIELLKQLQLQHQYAYILITHDFNVVSSMADKVIVMQQGQIVETGDARDILTKPKHSYTQELLTAATNIHTKNNKIITRREGYEC